MGILSGNMTDCNVPFTEPESFLPWWMRVSFMTHG